MRGARVPNYQNQAWWPHIIFFIIILVNTLGTELNVEKKKKIRQVLNVGNMLKNKENVSRKNDIWRFHNRGNNFKEKVMTITMFFVACKKVPQYPRVLTTLAFRVPYISEFYFGLTSWKIIVWKSIINWQQIRSKRGAGEGGGGICTPHISVVSMGNPIFLVHFCSLYLFNFT